jgi:branched-subunit amino acid ABC-type transport system permease component
MSTITGLLMVYTGIYQAALMYGAVVGILALGFRITHETSGYMNLGHSVNLGVGMAIGFLTIQQLDLNPIFGVLPAFIFTGVFNALIYLIFYHRMEKKNYSEALISLFGLVFVFLSYPILVVLEYVMRLNLVSDCWCGPVTEHSFSTPHFHYWVPKVWNLTGGFIEITLIFIVIIATSRWLYNDTKSAIVRALAENPDLLEVSGVNTVQLITLIWFIAGGLGGLAGQLSPYVIKGEMGRDVGLYFIPMIIGSIIAEKREPWLAGLAGLIIGAAHIVLLNWGQMWIGIWVGEYWNLLDAIFLVWVMFMKDRRISWLSPRRQ